MAQGPSSTEQKKDLQVLVAEDVKVQAFHSIA
jgi:hypothetical protein